MNQPNRASKIAFDSGFPKELRASFKRDLKILLPLAPRIYRVKVYLGNEEGQASIQVLLQYHHANIHISPSFFKMDASERWEVLVHEVVHALTDPLYNESTIIVESFFEEDSATKGYTLNRLEELNEEIVDSIALVLAPVLRKRVDTGKPRVQIEEDSTEETPA